MKRHMRVLTASCVIALSLPLFAESVVKVTDPKDNVESVPLYMTTKITFGESGVSISNEGADAVVFPYTEVKTISFGEGSGVKVLQTRNVLGLRQNPVYSSLEVTGHDGKAADLSVVSMSGARVVDVKGWKGEAVDVSSLAAGVYVLRINNKTIKFIKK